MGSAAPELAALVFLLQALLGQSIPHMLRMAKGKKHVRVETTRILERASGRESSSAALPCRGWNMFWWGEGRGWNLYCKIKTELLDFSPLPELYGRWTGIKVNKRTECCIFSFLWENTEDDGLQAGKTKILALSNSHELFVYEFTIEDGKYNPVPLHSCKEDTLKKLLGVKNISE